MAYYCNMPNIFWRWWVTTGPVDFTGNWGLAESTQHLTGLGPKSSSSSFSPHPTQKAKIITEGQILVPFKSIAIHYWLEWDQDLAVNFLVMVIHIRKPIFLLSVVGWLVSRSLTSFSDQYWHTKGNPVSSIPLCHLLILPFSLWYWDQLFCPLC